MKIKQATICKWVSRRCDSKVINDPSWEEIRDAIEALDCDAKNDLYLTPDPTAPKTYLCIGGGAGRYIVTGSRGNESFPTVFKAEEGDAQKHNLCVGGQLGLYPHSWILDLKTAVDAARSFYETSEFGGGGLSWRDV